MSKPMPNRSLVFALEPTFRCNLEGAICPRFSSEDPHVAMHPETGLERSRAVVERMP